MATVVGIIESSDALEVVPPVVVSPDAMSATFDIAAESDSGVPITADMLVHALAHAGVMSGIDRGAIDAALAESARTQRTIAEVVVARGHEAVRGTDARLAQGVELARSVGTADEQGRIDYRERDAVHSVENGAMVCVVVPPTEGVPRRDVRGNVAEAANGKGVAFHAGQGVEEREPGRFYATRDGVLWESDGRVDVVELFRWNGDVDYESGNLRASRGAIHVTGSVRSAFEVKAAAHVRVDGAIEDARVEAGGTLEVGGGIMPSAEGHVEVGGNVRAAFAQDTRIRAAGDIVLRNAALNCFLWAGGRVIVEHGRLIGGTTLAASGIVVRELGSEASVRTRVVLGESVGNEQLAKLKSNLDAMRIRLRALGIAVGTEADLLEQSGFAPEVRDEAALLLEGQHRVVMSARTLIGRMSALADEPERMAVTVTGTVHPNVIIQMRAHVYRVVERVRSVKFMLDAEKHRIVAVPI